MRKIIFLTLALFIFKSLQGQVIEDKVIIKEPKVTDFTKFGNLSISEYTGSLNLNIPLLEVQLNPFSENISLSYNSSGFSPNKKDGEFGMNWHMEVGGMISRQVKGKPDEHEGNNTQGKPHGTYYGTKRNNFNNDALFSLNTSVLYPIGENYASVKTSTSSIITEIESDIFNFSFHGVSGKFYINSNGIPVVVSNNNEMIKVDLTDFIEEPLTYSNCNPRVLNNKRSKIILTLDNGYIYEFGGNVNSLSYSLTSNISISNGYKDANNLRPVINAWNLTKIIAPNKDELIYEYNGFIEDTFCDFNAQNRVTDNSSDEILLTRPPLILEPLEIAGRELLQLNKHNSYSVQNTQSAEGPFYDVNKPSYLRKIYYKSFNDNSILFKIYFYNIIDDFRFYPEESINFVTNNPGVHLDQIKVYNKLNQEINTISFQYEVNRNRKFLTNIKRNNQFLYEFEYTGVLNLPATNTKAIDHWGFWNYNSETQSLIPSIALSQVNNLITPNVFGTERNASGYQSAGMLKKITYPTKGYSEFEYEPHDYRRLLSRTIGSNYLPAINTNNTDLIAGGSRIKKIIDFDGKGNTYSKSFVYKTINGESSGILMEMPIYGRYYEYVANYSGFWESGIYISPRTDRIGNFTINSNGINEKASEDKYITYSSVKTILENSSYIIRDYSNYLTNPDKNDINVLNIFNNIVGKDPHLVSLNPEPQYLEIAKNLIGISFNDMSNERGKLIEERLYKSDSTLVEKTNYIYNEDPARFNKFITNVKHTGFTYIQSFKIYTYPYFLTQKTIETHLNADIITNKIEYSYNGLHNYPSIEKHSTSVNNDSKEIKYFYPLDNDSKTLVAPNRSIMISRNIINEPLRKESYLNTDKLFENQTIFGNDVTTSSILKPKNTYESKFPNNLPNLPNGIGQLEKKMTIDTYDNKGNITQYTQEGHIPTTYIWGYNKTQPIAKIENATYAQVLPYVANLQTLSNGTNEANLLTALDNLRTVLPNAMVTTYTHIPLVGISTITDPKGNKITYHYDNFNRLEFVKDQDGNILSENKYHYKN